MEIRTPEDIEAACKVIYNLKDEIKKIEKQITCAKNKFEEDELKNKIHTAVYKVLNNDGSNAYAEIDILHRRYQIVLSRGGYYGWYKKQISIQTWEMDGSNPTKVKRMLDCDTISADYGINLVEHIILSIVLKRISMLKKNVDERKD